MAPLQDVLLKERLFYWSSLWHLVCCLSNNGKHVKYELDYIHYIHSIDGKEESQLDATVTVY
jgi:hypothetical protein